MVLQTECGLVIYINKNPCNYEGVLTSLKKLQHRGRESFGLGYISETSSSNYSNIQTLNVEKHSGTVEGDKISEDFKSQESLVWFGHTRYSTSGYKFDTLGFTQPLQYSLFNLDDLCILFNGNIPECEWYSAFELYPSLKQYYNNNKEVINDSFLILEFFKILKTEQYETHRKQRNQENSKDVFNKILQNILIRFIELVDRAFSMAIITEHTTWILRDKYGVRPLTMGKYYNESEGLTSLVVGSESCCFSENTVINYDFKPGSLSTICHKTQTVKHLYDYDLSIGTSISGNGESSNNVKHCLFEYLYFMRPETTANKINVKEFRIELGKLLIKEMKEYHQDLYKYFEDAKLHNKEAIIVCGIPKSGIIQAESFARHFDVQYLQFIKQKKDYPHRTFILENQEKRVLGCKNKYFIQEADKQIIKDKILIMIDDSIVRGNTIKYLIEFVKLYQPKAIHFMVSAPPIVNICKYGVDFPNIEELIINKKTIPEFQEYLDIDSLVYLKNNILQKKEDLNKNTFCMDCFTI